MKLGERSPISFLRPADPPIATLTVKLHGKETDWSMTVNSSNQYRRVVSKAPEWCPLPWTEFTLGKTDFADYDLERMFLTKVLWNFDFNGGGPWESSETISTDIESVEANYSSESLPVIVEFHLGSTGEVTGGFDYSRKRSPLPGKSLEEVEHFVTQRMRLALRDRIAGL